MLHTVYLVRRQVLQTPLQTDISERLNSPQQPSQVQMVSRLGMVAVAVGILVIP